MGTTATQPITLPNDTDAILGGLDSGLLRSVQQYPGTITHDPSVTLVRIHGFETTLWYRGVLSHLAIGSMVSIIYRTMAVHGESQSWILFIEPTSLAALCTPHKRRNRLTHYQHS